MNMLIEEVADHFVYVLIAGCFVISIVTSALTKILTTAARERSRREIAAYVAEGSIDPEQGERLIRVDVNRGQART